MYYKSLVVIFILAGIARGDHRVVNSYDVGMGSLRDAVSRAEDSGEEVVVLVPAIRLNSHIRYDSAKPLILRGNGVRITGSNTDIRVQQASSCYVYDLTISGGGIRYSDPSASTTTHFNLDNVSVWHSNSTGISFRGADNPIASVRISNSQIISCNGMGISAIKSNGDLYGVLTNVKTFLNGARSNADNIQFCQFSDGGLFMNVQNLETSSANEDGIEMEEQGEGDVVIYSKNIKSYKNGEENLEINERGNGNLFVLLDNIYCEGYEEDVDRNDGIEIRETSAGSMNVTIRNSQVVGSEHDNIRILPEGEGDAWITITNTKVHYSGDDGIDVDGLRVWGNPAHLGKIYLNILNCYVQKNGNSLRGNGIKAVSGQQAGWINIQGSLSDYANNTGGNLDLDQSNWTQQGLARILK